MKFRSRQSAGAASCGVPPATVTVVWLLLLMILPLLLLPAPASAQPASDPQLEDRTRGRAALSLWASRTMLPCNLANYASDPGLSMVIEAGYAGQLPMCELQDLFFWGFDCKGDEVISVRQDTCVPNLFTGEPAVLEVKLPAELSVLDSLESIEFKGNLAGPIPPQWSANTNLSRLLLTGGISGEADLPAQFSTLRKLTEVQVAMELSGTIPSQWSTWSDIRVLVLAGNGLSGALPASWSTFSNLSLMDVSYNNFTSTLPASWAQGMTEMGQFTAINSSLTGQIPKDISNWSKLSALSLANNRLTGTLPEENPELFPELNIWDVSGNRITGTLPASWGAREELIRFAVSRNQLRGPLRPEWSRFTSLLSLDLEDNQLTGPLPQEWSAMSSLYGLLTAGNQLSGTLPAAWSSMASLHFLTLDSNTFWGPMPQEWSGMRQMTWLSVAKNQLTGSIAPQFSTMRHLTHMDVSGNQLAGSVDLHGHPEMVMINLAGNRFAGSLPPRWALMANLTGLELSNNSFSASLPAEWSALVHLEHLDLLGNDGLSGSLPASWSAMTSLRWLGLPAKLCASLPPEGQLLEAAIASGSCARPGGAGGYDMPTWLIALLAVASTLLFVLAAMGAKIAAHRALCADPLCAHRHPGAWHSLDGHLHQDVRSIKCKWCMWDGQPDLAVPYAELSPLIDESNLIGCGGFSAVYRGQWRGRTVALKVLEQRGMAPEERLRVFQHEVDMCLRCNSCERMVNLYGACYDGAKLCLINEFLEGGSLDERIHGKGQPAMSVMETLQIAKDIATGLAFMHPEIVHRDIKPDNILLEKSGRAKIIDLGLGRVDDNPLLTHIDTDASGTASYMSPEQCEGRVTTKTDIFALAVLMNECITGQAPFANYSTTLAVQYAVSVLGKRPEMSPECPPKLRSLIVRCWDQDPNVRPGIRDVLFMIDYLIEDEITCKNCFAAADGGQAAVAASPGAAPSLGIRSHTAPPPVTDRL